MTGCRYSELARLVASNFDAIAGTITVRVGKSDKPHHAVLSVGNATANALITVKNAAWNRVDQLAPQRLVLQRAGLERDSNLLSTAQEYRPLVLDGRQ
jgi:hypothetical protein